MSINSQIKEQASVDASESKNKNAHNDNSDNGNNPNNNNENNNNENKVQNAYIRIGVYDIIKTIGHGNFSVCKLGTNSNYIQILINSNTYVLGIRSKDTF